MSGVSSALGSMSTASLRRKAKKGEKEAVCIDCALAYTGLLIRPTYANQYIIHCSNMVQVYSYTPQMFFYNYAVSCIIKPKLHLLRLVANILYEEVKC